MRDYAVKVDREKLVEHVRGICRSNLKRPAKICQKCPFLGPIIEIMDENGWKYNKRGMRAAIRNYWAE